MASAKASGTNHRCGDSPRDFDQLGGKIDSVATPDFDDFQVRVYASLTRVLERAPSENRLPVFYLMCVNAADEIAARRQQTLDDLWEVAEGTGLKAMFDTTMVHEIMANAFEGAAA
jgi:hypothetical protein